MTVMWDQPNADAIGINNDRDSGWLKKQPPGNGAMNIHEPAVYHNFE